MTSRRLHFTKMHGTGNDFVVLDARRRPLRLNKKEIRFLADRRFGVGADQVLILEKSKRADFFMRILNADGSEVEMCGNGIRCVALYAHRDGLRGKSEFTVETPAGIMRPVLRKDVVRVDMGPPILDAARIPTRAKGRVIEKPFRFAGVTLPMTCVSMGNPHAVIFVNDLDETPVEKWGPLLETHSFFPRRANIEFVQVLSPTSARVRVWERGAGLTMACGTGAAAVGVAGVLTGRLRRELTLSLPGGELGVQWAANDHVFLTGPAKFVYQGEVTVHV